MNNKIALPRTLLQLFGKTGRSCLTVMLLLALPVAGFTQETTGSINGTVSDDLGNSVSGATITALHVPTGVSRSTTTNSTGSYRFSGLRIGGPYVIELAGTSTYGGERIEQISIALGESYALDLTTRTTEIEEIVVSAQQQDMGILMGAGSNFDQNNIQGMANVNRDFKNIIRQDPRVSVDPTNDNAISIAGMNNRFNSLTIDGVRQNDDFGLNNSGFPTQRSPISIDSIEQIVVAVAPFDVSYGGFTGGTINAVTKSGTNNFSASLAYYHSNESLVGDQTGDDEIDLGNFDEDTIVATLSGPIIKDRLWFFASYDKFEATDTSALDYGPFGSGRANEIDGVSQADIDEVVRISDEVYGFNAGALPSSGTPIMDEKILVKLDWAITDSQTATLTYQDVEGNGLNPQGSSTFSDRLGLASNWYDKTETMETVGFQLFSRWTDAFSTELKLAKKEIVTSQESLFGTDYAQMTIDTADGGAIRVGPDIFRHANALTNDQTQFKLKGEYLVGDHTISAGYEKDDLDIFNKFVFQSEAEYNFDSIADYEAQTASRFVGYRNAFTNNEDDGAATFGFAVNSVYLQDIWDVSDQLQLQYGIRYDWYTGDDRPTLNPNFVARNGFGNDENLDGRNVLMPRLGFTYDFNDGTRLRGGVGLFSGGNPNVWVSNSFSNDGVTIVSPDFNGDFDAACEDLDESAIALNNVDPFNVPTAIQNCMFPGAGDVEATDPDFEIPSTWRFNVAVEREFDLGFMGEDWFLSFEAVISRANRAVEWRDLARTQIDTAPGGRPIYDTPSNYDVLLTNVDQGSSDSYSLGAVKTWDTRAGLWDLSLYYTYMDSDDVNPSQSSTVSSNYGRPATLDRNNRQLHTSDFEIEHRLNSTFGWQKNLFGNNTTRVSGFFEYRSGKRFSYTMRESAGDTDVWGGDSTFARRDSQLLYIPEEGASNVIFTTDAMMDDVNDRDLDVSIDDVVNDPNAEADFNDFVAAAGLSQYRGQILPRNHDTSADRTRIDIRIQQEIGFMDMPFTDSRLHAMLYLDIENLGNLLNNDWGRVEQVTFPHNATVVDHVTINSAGQYVYASSNDAFIDDVDPSTFFTLPSLYKIQLGIKIAF